MEIHVHVHVVDDVTVAIQGILQEILTTVLDLKKRIKHMSIEMDGLVQKVTDMEVVQDGVVVLLTTLKADLDTALANSDLPAIQALSDRIGADTQKLADAVAANTPAEV